MEQTTRASRLPLLACEEGCEQIEERLPESIHTTIDVVFDEELGAPR